MPGCRLHYIDAGANRGDSLEAFFAKRPDKVLRRVLDSADSQWHPSSTCVVAFEANAALAQPLRRVAQLAVNHLHVPSVEVEIAAVVGH